ncbi:hypothetical protein HGA64_00620 [Candidatus Falkowbacteria bacterium]|nr:hypothetical protein [Candidatus Falkowbacteria bacterium]
MKLWQSILLTLGIVVFILIIPMQNKDGLVFWVVLLSAIWSYADAGNKDINKYKITFAPTAGAVAVGMFFLWIIYFPLYLSIRSKMMNSQIGLREEGKVIKGSGGWTLAMPFLIIIGMIFLLSAMAIARLLK